MIKEKILLIGGGGHCKSCIDVIESEDKYFIAGIIDIKEKIGQRVFNYSIIGIDDDIPELVKSYKNFLVTLGQIRTPENRIKLYQVLKGLGVILPVIISPSAQVSKHSLVGEGTIIMHQACVNAGAKIGNNCIINSKALIEHDAIISDHCHISTGSIINGGVQVGEGTFYGSGSVSKENAIIPPNSFIKANSIVK